MARFGFLIAAVFFIAAIANSSECDRQLNSSNRVVRGRRLSGEKALERWVKVVNMSLSSGYLSHDDLTEFQSKSPPEVYAILNRKHASFLHFADSEILLSSLKTIMSQSSPDIDNEFKETTRSIFESQNKEIASDRETTAAARRVFGSRKMAEFKNIICSSTPILFDDRDGRESLALISAQEVSLLDLTDSPKMSFNETFQTPVNPRARFIDKSGAPLILFESGNTVFIYNLRLRTRVVLPQVSGSLVYGEFYRTPENRELLVLQFKSENLLKYFGSTVVALDLNEDLKEVWSFAIPGDSVVLDVRNVGSHPTFLVHSPPLAVSKIDSTMLSFRDWKSYLLGIPILNKLLLEPVRRGYVNRTEDSNRFPFVVRNRTYEFFFIYDRNDGEFHSLESIVELPRLSKVRIYEQPKRTLLVAYEGGFNTYEVVVIDATQPQKPRLLYRSPLGTDYYPPSYFMDSENREFVVFQRGNDYSNILVSNTQTKESIQIPIESGVILSPHYLRQRNGTELLVIPERDRVEIMELFPLSRRGFRAKSN